MRCLSIKSFAKSETNCYPNLRSTFEMEWIIEICMILPKYPERITTHNLPSNSHESKSLRTNLRKGYNWLTSMDMLPSKHTTSTDDQTNRYLTLSKTCTFKTART